MARSQNLHLCRKISSDCTHQLEISDSSRASTLERICLNQFFNLLLLLAGDLPLKRSLKGIYDLQSKDLPMLRRDFHVWVSIYRGSCRTQRLHLAAASPRRSAAAASPLPKEQGHVDVESRVAMISGRLPFAFPPYPDITLCTPSLLCACFQLSFGVIRSYFQLTLFSSRVLYQARSCLELNGAPFSLEGGGGGSPSCDQI